MILVAYSGSSKADWILQGQSSTSFQTSGFNPLFLQEKDMVQLLQAQPVIKQYQHQVSEVHFFGAGCVSPDLREGISNALSRVFNHAFICVEQDILGVSYATCGNQEGISCILGTGSNSVHFDGQRLHPSKYGLGYILGDEGSGAYFGKQLIKDFLYGNMPSKLYRSFSDTHQLNKERVIKKIYQEEGPCAYLGSLAPFMSSHIDNPYIQNLLFVGFDAFIKTHVRCFDNYAHYPCHFSGSIAYHFREILSAVCQTNKIQIEQILHRPTEKLAQFINQQSHLNDIAS